MILLISESANCDAISVWVFNSIFVSYKCGEGDLSPNRVTKAKIPVKFISYPNVGKICSFQVTHG